MRDRVDALVGWLADQGLRNLPVEELVDSFAHRLNETGLPIARVFIGTNTLHPLVRARSMIWDRAKGLGTHFEFEHTEIFSPQVRQSPFTAMFDAGESSRRTLLTVPPVPEEAPLFTELREEGMTEWLGRIFPFGELTPEVGNPDAPGHAGQLWLVCSFTTDRPGGYAETDIAALERLLPIFALAVKATTLRGVGEGLLTAYLGADPAMRVLEGKVLRGRVQSVEAVLLFADLRSFTTFADTLPGDELIALLDECFERIVQRVMRHHGEILKFMGDGLLAVFRIAAGATGPRRAEICASALAAASEALDLMAVLARDREAAGKKTPGLGIALHVGTVQYGNVGSDTRLDFTVIGPAVNEAARIEALCKELGHPLLVSEAFAAAATDSSAYLRSLGRHSLRGVREKTELFALA